MRRLSRRDMTTLMPRRRRSAYREAPRGRSSGVLTKAPVLAPLYSIGCFPLRTFIPSCAEKSSNIPWRSLPDFMARPEIANEDSFSDLAVRQNPSCSHEVQWCSYFVVGDDRPRRDPLPCLIGPCQIAASLAADRLTLPLACPLVRLARLAQERYGLGPLGIGTGPGGLSNSYGASPGGIGW